MSALGWLTNPVGSVIGGGLSLIGSIFGAKSSNKATTQAAQLQTDSANRAAELQKQSSDASLAFLREQEAARQAEYEKTNAYNFDIWTKENERARMEADRNFGLSSSQLAQSKYLTEAQMAQSADQFNQDIGLRRDQQAYIKALEAARQGRLKPYQQFGLGTLAQLSQPIPGAAPVAGGSLATLAGR